MRNSNLSKKSFWYIFSVLYALGEGLSFAAAVDDSVSADSDNKTWVLLLTGCMLFASFCSAFGFQGPAIREVDDDMEQDSQEEEDNEEIGGQVDNEVQQAKEEKQVHGSFRHLQEEGAPLAKDGSGYQSFNVDSSDVKGQKAPQLLAAQPNTGWCIKLGPMIAPIYCALVVGQYFISRYYLFGRLLDSFGGSQGSAGFWVLFGFDFPIKLLFGMSNEVWETLEGFAPEGWVMRGMQKILTRLFSSTRSISYLSAIGSLEHTLCDDLLPWVALLSKDDVDYIAKTSTVFWGVLVGSIVIGFPLVSLVFLQTYLYEGQHSERNLRVDPWPPLEQRNWVRFLKMMPGGAINAIDKISKSLSIMGPLHGSASMLPVYFSQRLSRPYLKWSVSPSVWGSSALGTHRSEVRMARKVLQETKQQLEEVAGGLVRRI